MEVELVETKSLERGVFIVEVWEREPEGMEHVADTWMKLRIMDESNIKKSWEVVAWQWKVLKQVEGKDG